MRRKLIFHIGLEKTGTTSFQIFCDKNRRLLARHGILYPRYRTWRRPDHGALVASYLTGQRRDFSVTRLAPAHEKAVGALKRELEASPAPTILISAEHFSSRFDHARATRLAQDFAEYDGRILVVVRDPHARFLAAYATSVISGGEHTPETYAAEVFDPANPYMRLAATLKPWEAAFGADRITFLDYDALPDMVAPLLAACGWTGRLPDLAAARRHKASLDADATRILRLCNRLIRERQGRPAHHSYPVWHQHIGFSRACQTALARAPGRPRRPWSLSAPMLAELDRIAAAERQWLADRYGLAVRGSDARASIVTAADPEAVEQADLVRARALVERVTRFRWAASQTLVKATLAVTRAA